MNPNNAGNISKKLPDSFRPLLWGRRWNELDVEGDREDIIVSVINEGSLSDWQWIVKTYGKEAIRSVLENRLASEFHSESRNLARLMFGISSFRHAR